MPSYVFKVYFIFFLYIADKPKSHQFDITLMVCLLRHIMDDIQVPRSGWDALPDENDTTIGADLARIKWYRNFDAHLPNCMLEDTEFDDKWEDLTGVNIL